MTTLFSKNKTVLYFIIAVCFMGCREDDHDPTPFQQLTSGEWMLTAHGIDFNSNNILDHDEDMIEDCQRDNTYLFYSNRTGLVSDNDLSCGNENSTNFNWQLLNNNTELEIALQSFEILTLSDHKLILSPMLPDVKTKVILQYTLLD